MNILGAVLAGGRSSRFGANKAEALWEGRPLIEHAWAQLERHCAAQVICGGAHADLPAIPDRPTPDLGPLGGLNAALHHAAAHGFERVLCIACDTPEAPSGLLAALAAGAAPMYLRSLPVIGAWPSTLAPALDRFVATDPRRSLRGWAEAAGAQPLEGWSVRNINTPGDLAALTAGR